MLPRLGNLAPSTAAAEVLRHVRENDGLVTFHGQGGGDQRLAERVGRKLEPLGIQWTLDRTPDDAVRFVVADGDLPGWTGSPHPHKWVTSAGGGETFSYTNNMLTYLPYG